MSSPESYSSFEQVRARLDAIVDEVNAEGVSLDEALALYEEAVKLGLSACDLSEKDALAVLDEAADEAAVDPAAEPAVEPVAAAAADAETEPVAESPSAADISDEAESAFGAASVDGIA